MTDFTVETPSSISIGTVLVTPRGHSVIVINPPLENEQQRQAAEQMFNNGEVLIRFQTDATRAVFHKSELIAPDQFQRNAGGKLSGLFATVKKVFA
jgi:hypothetical protein